MRTVVEPSSTSRPSRAVQTAIDGACEKIAPMWPLKSFVAVNPFVGFSGMNFFETCASMRRVNRTNMLMPREFYREAIACGVIEDRDIASALESVPADWKIPKSVNELKCSLTQDTNDSIPARRGVVTISEVLDELASGDRQVSRTSFMIDEISKFCSVYFDEGHALFSYPAKRRPLYSSWLLMSRYDRNAEAMGISGFRKVVAQAPKDAAEAISFVVDELGIPELALEDYLYRALFDIGGWASYAKHRVWTARLRGERDDCLTELLGIRVVWGYALYRERTDDAFKAAWQSAIRLSEKSRDDFELRRNSELASDCVLQAAYESAYRRELIRSINASDARRQSTKTSGRKRLQAAFCIDVRSEVFRRALEQADSEIETIGFAGFFGIPFEYVRIGDRKGSAQCPVLIKPIFKVHEDANASSKPPSCAASERRNLKRRIFGAWKKFKFSAVSCFAYVETFGLFYAAKIIRDSAGASRTVPNPKTFGLESATLKTRGPSILPKSIADGVTGFTDDQMVAVAKSLLTAMSMTKSFSRVVLLLGHESSTVNNPHAAGLDCGACGGNSGEPNARVAASILNQPSVRFGLKQHGVEIPEDTWFLGGLHNTTTDEVTIFDQEKIANAHLPELERVKQWLLSATQLAKTERAALLGLQNERDLSARIDARSKDWSQVRPEWGLAGNASFIIGPRSITRGTNLCGRAFMHSYDWQADANFKILESIMTAPMVVASWINLQYYGSTVNNPAFGSGNKVLHNVTGTIGVIEGNSGDLRAGLPWQSIHDGAQFIHKPVRLHVMIAAPIDAIDGVIEKHSAVRELADNQWIHLHSISDDGLVTHKYASVKNWIAV